MGLVLEMETSKDESADRLKSVVDLLLEIRMNSKNNKDWATSDLIRDKLKDTGIIVRDKKDGFDWELE
jgi:cysteinyl-tRNA synthetase